MHLQFVETLILFPAQGFQRFTKKKHSKQNCLLKKLLSNAKVVITHLSSGWCHLIGQHRSFGGKLPVIYFPTDNVSGVQNNESY